MVKFQPAAGNGFMHDIANAAACEILKIRYGNLKCKDHPDAETVYVVTAEPLSAITSNFCCQSFQQIISSNIEMDAIDPSRHEI